MPTALKSSSTSAQLASDRFQSRVPLGLYTFDPFTRTIFRETSQEDLNLYEISQPFSLAKESGQLGAAIGLGVVNLAGTLFLGKLLAAYKGKLIAASGANFINVVSGLYPFLLVYAVGFNVIPIIRNYRNEKKNEKIRERSQRRYQWFSLLKNPTGRLIKKFRAKETYEVEATELGKNPKDIVYDSNLSAEENKKYM